MKSLRWGHLVAAVGIALSLCILSVSVAGAQATLEEIAPSLPSLLNDSVSLRWYEALFIVFLTFWVMFSPLRAIGPFAAMTAELDTADAHRFARRAVVTSAIAGVVSGVIGQFILNEWGISIPALLMAISIVLFLVSIRNLIFPSARSIAPLRAEETDAKALQLVFPHILSPYGIATLILIAALASTFLHDLVVYCVFLAVMLLNYSALHNARIILKRGGALLAILGAVMGVLLVALSIQLFINAVYLLLEAA